MTDSGPDAVTLFCFGAPDGGPPVVLAAGTGTKPVTDHLAILAAGWPRPNAVPADPTPVARLDVAGAGLYRLESESLEQDSVLFDNALAAANAMVGLLVTGLLRPRPDWLCLHAAGIDFGGGAVLLVGEHRAGKSLFSALATADGARLISDDRVLLDLASGRPGAEVISLGVPPKLREPLPPGLPADAARFLGNRRGAAEGEMRFLDLARQDRPGQLLPFAVRRPLRRLLFLARDDAIARPQAAALGPGPGIARLLPHLYAPVLDAAGRLAAAHRLVAIAGADVLRYRDCWDALPLLRELAAGNPETQALQDIGDADR